MDKDKPIPDPKDNQISQAASAAKARKAARLAKIEERRRMKSRLSKHITEEMGGPPQSMANAQLEAQLKRDKRRNNEILRDTLQLAVEADEKGTDTIAQLEIQREQLERIDRDLAATNQSLSRSERLIKSLSSWGGMLKNYFTGTTVEKEERWDGPKNAPPKPQAPNFGHSRSYRSSSSSTTSSSSSSSFPSTSSTFSSSGTGSAEDRKRARQERAANRRSGSSNSAQTTTETITEAQAERRLKQMSGEDIRARQAFDEQLEREDDQLDQLNNVLMNLKYKGQVMHHEIVSSTELAEHLMEQVDKTNRRLRKNTRKINAIK